MPTRAEYINEANALCFKLQAQALQLARRAGAQRTLRSLDQIFRIDAGLIRRYIEVLQARLVPTDMRVQINEVLRAARAALRADERTVAVGKLSDHLAQSRSAALAGQRARERLRAAWKAAGVSDCAARYYA